MLLSPLSDGLALVPQNRGDRLQDVSIVLIQWLQQSRLHLGVFLALVFRRVGDLSHISHKFPCFPRTWEEKFGREFFVGAKQFFSLFKIHHEKVWNLARVPLSQVHRETRKPTRNAERGAAIVRLDQYRRNYSKSS